MNCFHLRNHSSFISGSPTGTTKVSRFTFYKILKFLFHVNHSGDLYWIFPLPFRSWWSMCYNPANYPLASKYLGEALHLEQESWSLPVNIKLERTFDKEVSIWQKGIRPPTVKKLNWWHRGNWFAMWLSLSIFHFQRNFHIWGTGLHIYVWNSHFCSIIRFLKRQNSPKVISAPRIFFKYHSMQNIKASLRNCVIVQFWEFSVVSFFPDTSHSSLSLSLSITFTIYPFHFLSLVCSTCTWGSSACHISSPLNFARTCNKRSSSQRIQKLCYNPVWPEMDSTHAMSLGCFLDKLKLLGWIFRLKRRELEPINKRTRLILKLSRPMNDPMTVPMQLCPNDLIIDTMMYSMTSIMTTLMTISWSFDHPIVDLVTILKTKTAIDQNCDVKAVLQSRCFSIKWPLTEDGEAVYRQGWPLSYPLQAHL